MAPTWNKLVLYKAGVPQIRRTRSGTRYEKTWTQFFSQNNIDISDLDLSFFYLFKQVFDFGFLGLVSNS